MSNQAYLQGVAEALSQMNVDPQIKVASYNELEKIALQGLRAGLAKGVQAAGEKAIDHRQRIADALLATAGAGIVGGTALGAKSVVDSIDEELQRERLRAALVLGGGTVALGGLGYGAYKAMD